MQLPHPMVRAITAAAAIIGLLAISLLNPARASGYSEDAIKAAYLYRFAGYIDWPQQGLSDAPFTIDILGAPEIARELRRLLPGHRINGQIAQVHEVTGNHDLGNPQIVYIAAGHADLVHTFLPQSSGSSMLLVTDEEGGLSSGSVFNFLTIDRNVRFEVSLAAAERWKLKISSELLGVAIRVQSRASQSFLGCRPPGEADGIHGPCAPRIADLGTLQPVLHFGPRS